ncbi:endopeptidase La [Flavobacterium agricola]|uniref:Lon protease n=1 Tax=Flavobacterium agricola TaxID=2870839 RepID=A0ABY6M4Y1_9FLAO|nr:endopeptidase La [Flavobacterium agricola]UYW02541.1 endopeptidase La [Flavobacterium agricola]
MSKNKIITIDSMSLQELDADSDLIPLLTSEEEEEMNQEIVPNELAILPLRNMVLFPGVVIPITAGREKSIALIKEANANDKNIGVVSQIDEKIENPGADDIYKVGTVARILRVINMPDGNMTVILQGKKRFQVDEVIENEPYLKATVIDLVEERPAADDEIFVSTVDAIKDTAVKYISENGNIPTDLSSAIVNIESNPFLINFVSSNLTISVSQKQQLLENNNLQDKAINLLRFMNTELQKLQLRNDIQNKVRVELDQQQKEYYLNQQMKTIQDELGGVSNEQEIEQMKAKSLTKKWSEKVAKHFEKEIAKLQRMNPQSPDYGVQRNYLELYLDLPWQKYSRDKFDLDKAQKILDREHFGLEDVKKRIIEHLAVLKLRKDMKSPILCLYGPPGVGKTSIGKSIAEALGREYIRISLGGLRDESEIRGHRKTYIGAMPGRIIQSLKKAGTSNPVIVLDEIDKLSHSHNGDPSSALLEVLDPEQNSDFYDNFLEMGYDLSKVMFIATSNDMSTIQPALRDRMEVIHMSGYTIEEKIEIGSQHLFPKQLKEHGLTKTQLRIEKPEIGQIVTGYTRESGVRGLDKKLAAVVRNVAKSVVLKEDYNRTLTPDDIVKILGTPKLEQDLYENNDVAGVVTGLAWTSVGGDILFIESIASKGKGQLSITGNLGTVMKESATIALEYIKAHADEYNIKPEVFEKYNIHMHVPEGATPKDGPSAGITMLTSLISTLTQKRVKTNLAMTGEITLRGKVLPVGGIKEKILAAKRSGITEIILCADNKKDIDEIKTEYLEGLTFHYVTKMDEVIKIAVTNEDVANPKEFKIS